MVASAGDARDQPVSVDVTSGLIGAFGGATCLCRPYPGHTGHLVVNVNTPSQSSPGGFWRKYMIRSTYIW